MDPKLQQIWFDHSEFTASRFRRDADVGLYWLNCQSQKEFSEDLVVDSFHSLQYMTDFLDNNGWLNNEIAETQRSL